MLILFCINLFHKTFYRDNGSLVNTVTYYTAFIARFYFECKKFSIFADLD